ncbi:zona pellucida sperm-binding protein 3-like [Alligator sinensis]|uniref:Zona pellucida sperm-binding protein 3 n=1 Tax=Alligator sinensis TaxID=38654 RepID=A0A1U7S679_ALLSI|nr:zona pellucida sperm-binding protein 3-like [Alligator sinensis]
MGSKSSLGFALLCWVLTEVACYNPWDFSRSDSASRRPSPRADFSWRQSSVPSLAQPYSWAGLYDYHSRGLPTTQPVSVQCQEAQMVITVNRDLFGTGRLINVADLSLGPVSCKYTSLNPVDNTVTFAAGLHECGSTVQMTPDSLVYRTVKSYNPPPAANAVIIRTNPTTIPIECHYPRKENVSSKAIKPTWAPFVSTVSAEERLAFSLRLMNDDWSAERPFTGFQLGDVLNIQAEVTTGSHMGLRLFVDSCVATLTPEREASPHYSIIDFNGCLVDGRLDDASSAFITPRPRQDMLRFTVDVFRFSGDASNLIYITCHLKVTPVEQVPDPLNKACSFNKAGNIWSPVEGTRDICSCCETRNCGLLVHSRRINHLDRWAGRRFRRDVSPTPDLSSEKEVEVDVVVGPLFLSIDQGPRGVSEDQEETLEGAAEKPGMMVGLVTMAAAVALAAIALGVVLIHRKCGRSSSLA